MDCLDLAVRVIALGPRVRQNMVAAVCCLPHESQKAKSM